MYNLAPMDKYVDCSGGKIVYFTVDGISGYYIIEFFRRDREKKGLTSSKGFYRLFKVLFRLEYAPVTFKIVMDVMNIFSSSRFKCVYFVETFNVSDSVCLLIKQIKWVWPLMNVVFLSYDEQTYDFFAATVDNHGERTPPNPSELSKATTNAVAKLKCTTPQAVFRVYMYL